MVWCQNMIEKKAEQNKEEFIHTYQKDKQEINMTKFDIFKWWTILNTWPWITS